MNSSSLSPELSAVVTWLTEGARPANQPQDVVQRLCSQLVSAGLAIDRCAVFVTTLHPNIMGRRFIWNPGQEVDVGEAPHRVLDTDLYRRSTAAEVIRTGKTIRLRMSEAGDQDDYNIADELRSEGFTDYVMHPLDFLNGENHAVSWATKSAGGFSDEDMAALNAIRGPLSRIAEIYALKRMSINLLDTYLGHRTGQRILEGKIRRGDIERINAAIMVADLRGFTSFSDQKSGAEVIDLLNAYYDSLVPPIEEGGGEVLKFMGDGLLAIFPIEQEHSSICCAALKAAKEGQKNLCELESHALRCGIALHLGEVLYGNIGGANRLDFTTIGPAVNLTARLEPFTRDLERPILTSAAFAEHLAENLTSLGRFDVRGFNEKVEIFAPSIADETAA
ncbi:MAG: adenylate/guanylate cyclase domain-containing protein [Geminicoccaceae bacterium]